MRTLESLSLCCLIVAQLAGCQTSPAPAGTGLLVEPADAMRLGYTIGPVTDLGIPIDQNLEHAVILDRFLITVESPSNLITAVSLDDGSVVWRQVIGGKAHRLFKPMMFEGQILVNSESDIYLLNADTGQPIEQQPLEAHVSHHPGMLGSLAIFGSAKGLVFAHDLRTGYSKWRRQMSGNVLASPVVYRNDVFVGDGNGQCAMRSAISGQFLWPARTFGPIVAPPAINRTAIFLACNDQSLYALNRDDGRDQWIYRAGRPLRHRPVIIRNTLFLRLTGKGLQAIDTSNGKEKWFFASDVRPITTVKDRLLVHNPEELLMVDLESGKTTKQIPIQRLHKIIPIESNRLLLISPRGQVLRLDPHEG